jgi:outer membrane protein assembly factor BamE (lipoprotein component of BamABCDE complex)
MTKAVRIMGLAAMMSGLVLAGGCVPLRSHQGYIIDADLVNSVQPGVDNRASVLQTLGKPTIASQFNNGEWYYVARDSRNLAFRIPQAQSQVTLKITFNQAGVVESITRTGKDQIASIAPYSKTTPTLGRKRGFFEDLFGNIGAVGAAGAGGPGGPGGPGGDDSRP